MLENWENLTQGDCSTLLLSFPVDFKIIKLDSMLLCLSTVSI